MCCQCAIINTWIRYVYYLVNIKYYIYNMYSKIFHCGLLRTWMDGKFYFLKIVSVWWPMNPNSHKLDYSSEPRHCCHLKVALWSDSILFCNCHKRAHGSKFLVGIATSPFKFSHCNSTDCFPQNIFPLFCGIGKLKEKGILLILTFNFQTYWMFHVALLICSR